MVASSVQVRVIRGEHEEIAALQRVLEAAPDYFRRVTGVPPDGGEAQRTYRVVPAGKGWEDKHVLGVFLEGEMVGCADLVRRYPEEHMAHVGLFLIAERHQQCGLGTTAWGLIEVLMREWPECRTLRGAVVRTNASVLRFWERIGFSQTGEVEPYCYGSVSSELVIIEKPLQR
ncbi:MAG: GNAT family N-acetyltransferase [Deltaproteobacteria bacterium]|nr:GNAT family N-acetyltransferase [Deltaproteobacteria bacterium]